MLQLTNIARKEGLQDYIAVSSFQIKQHIYLPIWYFFILSVLELISIIYITCQEISDDSDIGRFFNKFNLRNYFHTQVPLQSRIYIVVGLISFNLLIAILFMVLAVVVTKNEKLQHLKIRILKNIFLFFGHFFILTNYVLVVPVLIIFTETLICAVDDNEI